MIDIIVGLLVVIIIGAALFYIRKEKKKGACVGCPLFHTLPEASPGDSDHSCELSYSKK